MPSEQDESRRQIRVAPESPTRVVVRDKINLVVVIAGTVDPGNLGEARRAASYSRPGVQAGDPSYWGRDRDALERDGLLDGSRWYWQEQSWFRARIDELDQRYRNLHVFVAHGWSGDNSSFNREVTGKYLADRLCGAEGLRAYYAGWLSREVHVHLIGHSHGGNVINELCREAARVWPDHCPRWKIRTVMYLSTPFFQTLHRVDTGAFDPDCKVVNVIDEFDLTQQTIADFNLRQMNRVLELAGFEAVLAAAQPLLSAAAAAPHLQSHLEAMLGTLRLDVSRFELMLGAAEGYQVYSELEPILRGLRSAIAAVEPVIHNLHRGIEFPAAVELVGRISQGRRILSSELRDRWLECISELVAGLDATLGALRRRMRSSQYPFAGVMRDFGGQALHTIVHFLRTPVAGQGGVPGLPGASGPAPGSLSSILSDLVVDTLLEQIERFDDTSASPADQLAGTAFAGHVIEVDVTSNDALHGLGRYADHARELLCRLREIERRYMSRRLPDDLVDLALTLLAQLPAVHDALPGVRAAATALRTKVIEANERAAMFGLGDTVAPLTRPVQELADTVLFWIGQLEARYIGETMVQPPVKSPYADGPDDPFVGELAYLAIVSHSQSRYDLYPEVLAELESQLTTRPRRQRPQPARATAQ